MRDEGRQWRKSNQIQQTAWWSRSELGILSFLLLYSVEVGYVPLATAAIAQAASEERKSGYSSTGGGLRQHKEYFKK